ncbi:MAG: hypothetical protein JNK48_22835 [Bryobacterales bacterium]|nr:hypothetical protein [Bryobacterales bacterium]
MRFSLVCAALLSLQPAAGQWLAEAYPVPPNSKGAATEGGHLITWGEGLYRDGQRLHQAAFGPGGCLYDVNADGYLDAILHRLPGDMVWLEGPRFAKARRIDTEADFADCLGASLFGRRGVIVVHRGMQVRFYLAPSAPATDSSKWSYREIYSFYTSSYQAGLLLRDIEGDGFPDLVCGNYWIRSPKEFHLPWRLFAINTYHHTPESAHFRLQWIGGSLLASQTEMQQGRLMRFTPHTDVTQQWTERLIAAGLERPRAAVWRNGDLLVSEGLNLWLYRRGSRMPLHRGLAIHSLIETEGGFLAIGASGALRLKQLP